MNSYNQPWTVVDGKNWKYGAEPKTHEYSVIVEKNGLEESEWNKPQFGGKWEKYSGLNKSEYYGKHENGKYGKYESEYYGKHEGPKYNKYESEFYGKYETPKYGKYECPKYGKYESEFYGKYETPKYGKFEEEEECRKGYYYGREENQNKWEQNGEWEKVYRGLERGLEGLDIERKGRYTCESNKCCDEEMINLIKSMIHCLIGAEQSYIQLGFLCMDEKLTLTNTSEYFRLCGLRMRWLAHGLIKRSVRLFNVNEWINNTTFQNWFKVPTKEELATNDFTSVIKTFFNIALEAEKKTTERMHVLAEKLMKVDWINTECRFEGFKWFVNFVLPYQMHFVRVLGNQWNNIEMCDNGYIFDKCEMRPLVNKIEEFIHDLVKANVHTPKTTVIVAKKW